ncbi:hypothetical protein [Poriferisphaera sp. WC338]|uniref:hypothetical protein n=1 Tax=Poriferisphaera sp. WC338 TaxID=3425129 RepID=UPI003D81B259
MTRKQIKQPKVEAKPKVQYAYIRSRQLELARKGKVIESAKYATLAAEIRGNQKMIA